MSDEFIYTFESAEVIVSHIPALNRRKSSNFPFRSIILYKYTIFPYVCQTITEKKPTITLYNAVVGFSEKSLFFPDNKNFQGVEFGFYVFSVVGYGINEANDRSGNSEFFCQLVCDYTGKQPLDGFVVMRVELVKRSFAYFVTRGIISRRLTRTGQSKVPYAGQAVARTLSAAQTLDEVSDFG